jgi:hypothetical protein
MLPAKRGKLTMEILGKLREKGAPNFDPFPGEQSFENQGEDISPDGSVVGGAIPPELQQKKKKKPQFTPMDDDRAVPPTEVIGGY